MYESTRPVGLPGTLAPLYHESVFETRVSSATWSWWSTQLCSPSAVGSTTVRTLETMAAAHGGAAVACSGRSRLFIREPYPFCFTDRMLTNFHLPRSTLLMMVAALAGRERILAAYREAVARRYRFFSYGDCMLIV